MKDSTSLLSKWNWRIFDKQDDAQYDLHVYIYGDIKAKILDAIIPSNGKRDSIWWKDLGSVGVLLVNNQNLLNSCITCKLANGRAIYFKKHR